MIPRLVAKLLKSNIDYLAGAKAMAPTKPLVLNYMYLLFLSELEIDSDKDMAGCCSAKVALMIGLIDYLLSGILVSAIGCGQWELYLDWLIVPGL